jgi:hypothetical protein
MRESDGRQKMNLTPYRLLTALSGAMGVDIACGVTVQIPVPACLEAATLRGT